MPTDQEIYENRKRVITYLKQSHLKKAKQSLSNERTGGRCCLGHMCDALDVDSIVRPTFGLSKTLFRTSRKVRYYGKEEASGVAPKEVQIALGLHSNTGYGNMNTDLFIEVGNRSFENLACLNDDTMKSTQEIGAYLETVIMGGDGTPWKAIKV